MGERDQAIAFFCVQLCDACQRSVIAEVMERERRRFLCVDIPGHRMIIWQRDGKSYHDEQTQMKLDNGELTDEQIRALGNALRVRLGQEPIERR